MNKKTRIMFSSEQDLTPEKKKQLIQFYKAIKAAATMFPGVHVRQKIASHVDEIITELKKDQPNGERIQQLTEQMQAISSSVSLPGK